MRKSAELREQRAKLHADAAEILRKNPLTKEDREKFDKMMADVDSLKADIDRYERAERAEAELGAPLDPQERERISEPARVAAIAEYRDTFVGRGRPDGNHSSYLEAVSPANRPIVREIHRRYFEAMRLMIVGQAKDEHRAILAGTHPEFRDLGIGSNALGGYLVPQGFVYELEIAMKFFGGMLEVARIMDTATGQPLPYPTMNDTTVTGEIVGEGAQVSDVDAAFGHLVLNAWKYSTKMVKVSLELLQDSAFDLEAYLKEAFAIRLGRILNTHFTTGSGTNQPNGIVTAAVANDGTPQAWGSGSGPGIPLIAGGSAGNDGGSETGTNSIGSQDLVNLEHSVDRLYRKGARYMMHDTSLRYLKQLLDKYGRPLWLPGIAANAPDTINGYPYTINNDVAQIAASANTVLFGRLDKYIVRRVKELSILTLVERFADYGQRAFIGFARYDGNLLDAGTHPVNYLQQHS